MVAELFGLDVGGVVDLVCVVVWLLFFDDAGKSVLFVEIDDYVDAR